MPFREIDGNLIELTDLGMFDVIAHGCNAFCKMGAGIALSLRKRWPVIYEVDCQTPRGYEGKLGTIGVASVVTQSGFATVVNCYTQYKYGTDKQHVEYGAVRSCMQKIAARFKGKRIGLPKIGCNLAGGKWSIVKNIIIEELVDCDVTIVHYKG